MDAKEIRAIAAALGMTETSYDLKKEDDVKRLADDLSKAWADAIGDLADHVDAELLGFFFVHLFAKPFGVMGAQIGWENSQAAINALLQGLRMVIEAKAGAKH